jgi:uncharacterized small protein (DUF1192 family)
VTIGALASASYYDPNPLDATVASAEVRRCGFDVEVERNAGERADHQRSRGRDDGLNLAGVQRVLALESEVARLQADLAKLPKQATEAVADAYRQHKRELVPLRQAVAVIDTTRR